MDLNFIETLPVILRSPFIPDCPVRLFNVRVLQELAWLDAIQVDATLLDPLLNAYFSPS